MSFVAPTLERTQHKTTAKCGHCNKTIAVGDLILQYVSSTFRNSTHWRKIHFKCLLEKSEMDIGTILMLAAMPEAKNESE